ncbi:MAG: MFS transporter [Deltaproteobacteria bacterium]|nr:MFS transporter [Deltaproteobacteria bacterium]
MTPSESIWTRAFGLLCLTEVLGYAHHFMLMPALPLYVTEIGGTAFTVGLVISCFAVTSVVIRPLMGSLADRWGEAQVIVGGMLILAFSVLLFLSPALQVLMLANALRGIGWAGINAGGYSMLARTAPLSRRGEASGYYSGMQNSATILFPAVALWLLESSFGGFSEVFLSAVALTVMGAGCGTLLVTLAPRGPVTPPVHNAAPCWRDLFNLVDRAVLLPSSLHFCLQLSLPSITSFMVLYARESNISSIAWFYVVSGITSLIARPILGRVSDRIGRGQSLVLAFALQTATLCSIVMVNHLTGLLVCGMFYILTIAIGSSTTLALAMERADPERRGRSMASFSMAYPLSNGVGGFLAGAAVDLFGFTWMYLMMAGLAAMGLAVTLSNWSKIK